MMQVVEEVGSLRLDVLDADWVQGIYYSEFLEFGEFPAEYEAVLESLEVRKTFKHIMRAIDDWLSSDEPDDDKSWAALSNHVPHEKLLAILAYYIDHGTKNVVTKEFRNNALLASRVYYKFLAVPGYKAYHIYHSQLFAHSLACLGFPKAMCDNEDSYFNTKELTNEVNSVIRELRHFVLDLRAIIESLQLSPTDMNFEDILSNLVDVTGGAIVNRLNVDKIELANISGVIYHLIDVLICDADGEPDAAAIQLLFKCILPKLVAASVDSKNASNLVRASYVTYSGLLLSKYGRAAVVGYTVLLQHLCYTPDGLERAEVRQARVSLVVGLMSMLPRKSYRQVVKWLIQLTTVAKVAHRQIALEMLSKLLCNDPEEEKPKTPEPEPNTEPQSDLQLDQLRIVGDNQQPVVKPCYIVLGSKETDETPKDNTEAPLKDNNTNENIHSDVIGEPQNLMDVDTVVEQPKDDQTTEDQPNTKKSDEQPKDNETSENVQKDNEASENVQSEIIEEPRLMDVDTIEDLPNDGFMTAEQLKDGQTTDEQQKDDQTAETPKDGPTNEQSIEAQTAKAQTTEGKTTEGQTSEEQPKEVQVAKDQPTEEHEKDVQKPKERRKKGRKSKQSKKSESDQAANDIMTADDESSQDSQSQCSLDPEEDVSGLLRARAHTVPHAAVVRAVFERVNDCASTVRARAFGLLTEFTTSGGAPHATAMQELRGDGPVSRLMAAAARGVCDERAAVRRAALALVHRCIATAETMQRDDLAVLVGLCRDASIIVRSAAINALGELATSRPCGEVMDAFLNGPMHQLSDPETKVQEQVMSLLQQILIERLHRHSAGSEDPLPWMVLEAVTRHNMRRHLQRACQLLAKTASGINVRLVDIMSSHLGAVSAARDLLCLVLLTSVARHVDYGDVSFAVDYYYRLVDDSELRTSEPRLMALSLELLTLWARWLGPGPRGRLRDHVVTGLARDHDDGCRLAAVSLAAHLDPNNLVWATELMQMSERRAVTGTDIDEWLRAADLSLVAPEPPSQELIRLFLTAINDPPQEWSGAQLGACVAGVGRLSVRSRAVAAAAAPRLAATLRDHGAPIAARHNALLALADICTRYTCIVEPLLGQVCGCLEPAAEPLLRRAAARALTRLLLAGYLRLRTPLYYRYCALLADEDHEVREPAEYYVTSCLAVDTIYHHFVDCIWHFNEENTESLSFDARQLIYDVMVQRLSLVQRLNLQCRLAREVLERAADVLDEGADELPPAVNAALLDTITLLCGPRMKLPKKPQRDGETADLDDLQERVTTNIVSHKMKSMVAEVLVPSVLRLYARLSGGQAAAYLVRIANDLLQDYRQEIEELIENDEELVERVRQFQETIGLEPSFGNTRNLVTASTAHDPETPRAPRRRARPSRSPRKRALNI